MILKDNDTLLMIGDSITDAGRSMTDYPGIEPALGSGYVAMVAETLRRLYPEKRIRVVNKGIGGNTTRDLKNRWQKDVLNLRPDRLSIKIGINDVWRKFDCPNNPEWAVPIDEYEANLNGLVESAKPVVKTIILLTPYFIESNRSDAMRAMMDDYGRVVKRISEKYSTLYVDTQAPFDEFLKTHHPMNLCWDRVHPNAQGHYLIAQAFLKTIGVPSM